MSARRERASQRRGLRVAGLLAGLLAAASAVAGSFSVSPVRVYMQGRDRATAITISNEGDTELVMQAELFEWKQKPDGTDDLTPTDDMVMAPPVLKLAPKSRQVLRLANLKPVIPGQQLTYRLLVREIPEAVAPVNGAQVQVALAFSIPVFVTPPGAKQRLNCSAKGRAPDAVLVSCENLGQAYAQPVNFSLSNGSVDAALVQEVAGGYILPQMSRVFEIKRPGKAIAAGPAKLTVAQDDGSKQTFDVLLPE